MLQSSLCPSAECGVSSFLIFFLLLTPQIAVEVPLHFIPFCLMKKDDKEEETDPQLSWLERSLDKRKVTGSSPVWSSPFSLYIFERCLTALKKKCGNIAQLVEHCLCKAGAKGSNPFISTLLFSCSVHAPFGARRTGAKNKDLFSESFEKRTKEVINPFACFQKEAMQVIFFSCCEAAKQELWQDASKGQHFFLGQRTEGLWWRPRHSETMKGAEAGDTLRGAGNKHRSEDSRIGQPLSARKNSFLNSQKRKRQPGELKHLSSQRTRKQKRFPEQRRAKWEQPKPL